MKWKSLRSEIAINFFGTNIIVNKNNFGSKSNLLILFNGKEESRLERSEIKKESQERQNTKREINKEKRKINSKNI